jgi:HSP20 family molecular chaperone IbpA
MTENNNSNISEASPSPKKDLKSCFGSILSSKVLCAIIFILLGSLITIFVQNYQQRQRIFRSYYPDFYDRNFSEEMRLMEKRIDNILKNHNQYVMTSLSTNHTNNDRASKSEVAAKQDDNYYYYELNFSGFKQEDVRVDVKDNILTFKAENKKDSGNDYFSSNFYYSFSVPEYDVSKEPEIIRDDSKITVKFNKKAKNRQTRS